MPQAQAGSGSDTAREGMLQTEPSCGSEDPGRRGWRRNPEEAAPGPRDTEEGAWGEGRKLSPRRACAEGLQGALRGEERGKVRMERDASTEAGKGGARQGQAGKRGLEALRPRAPKSG